MSFLLVLQTIVAVLMVGLVLMHSAKGDGLGGIGGQAHVFGAQRDLEKGLDQVTTVMAVLFILISFIIAIKG